MHEDSVGIEPKMHRSARRHLRSASWVLPLTERRVKNVLGGCLNQILVLEGDQASYALRFRVERYSRHVATYHRELFAFLDCNSLGLRMQYRSVCAEVDFLSVASRTDARVICVAATESEWYAYSYIEGVTLAAFLSSIRDDASGQAEAYRTIQDFLIQLFKLHRKGVACPDRWGGNEVVDANGRVTLIDFDVGWTSAGRVQFSADLAIAASGVLLVANGRTPIAEILLAILSRMLESSIYDRATFLTVLRGYKEFYGWTGRTALRMNLGLACDEPKPWMYDRLLRGLE